MRSVPDGAGPNPNRWTLFKREAESGGLDDYRYTSRSGSRAAHGPSHHRGTLDVSETRCPRVSDASDPSAVDHCAANSSGRHLRHSGKPGNLTGFPDLIVPAGFTRDDLPVALSFFGRAFSEASCWHWVIASSRLRARAVYQFTRQSYQAR